MTNISERLIDISKHINKTNIIIDVGCDHALLSIYLVKKLGINKIYVSDNKELALKQGINNIKKNKLNKQIIPLLGNGLEVINDPEINTLIISGLGTKTILNIINHPKIKQISKIIIQSNTELPFLRENITKIGYKIIKETISYDNKKYYSTISFIPGDEKYAKRLLDFGFHHNLNYYNYLMYNLIKINQKIPNKHLTKKIINIITQKRLKYHIHKIKSSSSK